MRGDRSQFMGLGKGGVGSSRNSGVTVVKWGKQRKKVMKGKE